MTEKTFSLLFCLCVSLSLFLRTQVSVRRRNIAIYNQNECAYTLSFTDAYKNTPPYSENVIQRHQKKRIHTWHKEKKHCTGTQYEYLFICLPALLNPCTMESILSDVCKQQTKCELHVKDILSGRCERRRCLCMRHLSV